MSSWLPVQLCMDIKWNLRNPSLSFGLVLSCMSLQLVYSLSPFLGICFFSRSCLLYELVLIGVGFKQVCRVDDNTDVVRVFH